VSLNFTYDPAVPFLDPKRNSPRAVAAYAQAKARWEENQARLRQADRTRQAMSKSAAEAEVAEENRVQSARAARADAEKRDAAEKQEREEKRQRDLAQRAAEIPAAFRAYHKADREGKSDAFIAYGYARNLCQYPAHVWSGSQKDFEIARRELNDPYFMDRYGVQEEAAR
jgi:hypothetical protein